MVIIIINIIRWPQKEIIKYTFLCKYCGTQWECDVGDIKWNDGEVTTKCPICGINNIFYNHYEEGIQWSQYKRNEYIGIYEVPILKGEIK